MTAIIGIIDKKKDKVYIGGDSCGSNHYTHTLYKNKKVFKIKGFVFGCTTSFRMTQLINFSFKPPKIKGKELMEYMCTDFVEELRKVLKDGGFAKIDSNVEQGGDIIVGYKNRMFTIQSDFSVLESMEDLLTVGSGCETTLASAKAYKEMNFPEVSLIEKSLKISSEISNGVKPPFFIVNT